jgi:hypothetical protein
MDDVKLSPGYDQNGRPIDRCMCGQSFRTGEDYRAVNWGQPAKTGKLNSRVKQALDTLQLEFELIGDENAMYKRQVERDTKVVRDFAASLGFPMPNSHIGDIITVLGAKLTVIRLLEALKDETRIPASRAFVGQSGTI